MAVGEEDFQSILENGISFGKGGERKDPNEGKVKTKAKKKKYITGAHGSGSAKQKAKYREQRANRKHKMRQTEKFLIHPVQSTHRIFCIFAV